jgi:ferredoxin
MTHIITSLCVREGSCVTVCPVECIIPGKPQEEWPWFYIDPNTCIDCGACIPECPFHAIFPEDDVPDDYLAYGGEILSEAEGTAGFDQPFEGHDYEGNPIHLSSTRTLEQDEEVDLTPNIQPNYDYFTEGPGYAALFED